MPEKRISSANGKRRRLMATLRRQPSVEDGCLGERCPGGNVPDGQRISCCRLPMKRNKDSLAKRETLALVRGQLQRPSVQAEEEIAETSSCGARCSWDPGGWACPCSSS